MKRHIIKAAAAWALLVLLLAALCIVTGSAWALTALCFCVLLPFVSYGLNFALRNKFHLTLTLPITAAKGAAVPVTAEIRNTGMLPALRIIVPLRIRNDLTGEGTQKELLLSVGARGSQTVSFLVGSAFCGRLSIQTEQAWLMDYFGFLPIKLTLNTSARTTVLPDMFPSEIQVSPAPVENDEGTEERRGPDRSEIHQLREYRPGDDVRQIHWKLSSKLDTLVWKEPSMPESRSLLVLWDKRAKVPARTMDAMAEAVSSVCLGIVNDGIPFELCWTEDEVCACRIETENELLQAIPALVKTAGSPSCELPELGGYGAVIYFGTELPEREEDPRIRYLLCGQSSDEKNRIWGFMPENIQDTLRRLEM